MTTKLSLTISCLFFCFISLSQVSIYDDHKMVEEYDLELGNTIKIPMDFATSGLIKKLDLHVLEGKTIHHVDLVYTSYKESDSFDQEKLNKSRIARLKRVFPEVKKIQPTWSFVEQTGAETREDAQEYFHGFVIHYGESFAYKDQKNFFLDYQSTYRMKVVGNEEPQELTFEGGTTIRIPEKAVCHQDGTPVHGDYQFFYREYRDLSDIVLSGIPMTYMDGDTTKMFNSVGMFEIRGIQNGKELKLQKDVSIDFTVSKSLPDVSFYEMDDEGDWEEKRSIEFEGVPSASGNSFGNAVFDRWNRMRKLGYDLEATVHTKPFEIQTDGSHKGWSEIEKGSLPRNTHQVQLNEDAYERYIENRKKNERFFHQAIIAVQPTTNSFLLKAKDVNRFVQLSIGHAMDSMKQEVTYSTLTYEFFEKPTGNDNKRMYGASKVMGLVASNFAVYNCDQVGRITYPMAFSPTYYDKKSGKKIKGTRMAYVIDLGINGALSFVPSRLTCSRYGRNKVLLFTSDLDVYIINQNDFAAVNLEAKQPKLFMTNVTSLLQQKGNLKLVFDV